MIRDMGQVCYDTWQRVMDDVVSFKLEKKRIVVAKKHEIWVWGENSHAQCGREEWAGFQVDPIKLMDIENVQEVWIGRFHGFLLAGGQIYGWGNNSDCELGINRGESEIGVPTPIDRFVSVVRSISCGIRYTIVVMEDGLVYGWGRNHRGQAGVGIVECVSAGDFHCLALDKDGRVYGWGDNKFSKVLPSKYFFLFLLKPVKKKGSLVQFTFLWKRESFTLDALVLSVLLLV